MTQTNRLMTVALILPGLEQILRHYPTQKRVLTVNHLMYPAALFVILAEVTARSVMGPLVVQVGKEPRGDQKAP